MRSNFAALIATAGLFAGCTTPFGVTKDGQVAHLYVLEVWTTEPCLQLYGSQNMTSDMPAKAEGAHLCAFAGVALEPQHYPDSPNHPEFPSTVLRPGQVFWSRTECRFGVR